MSDSKLTMFGKTYNTVGSTDSNFVIKTKGDLKILWGNKFIDLIKGGKIVSSSTNIFKIVDTEDQIKENGIYLVDDVVWICINNNKVNLGALQENAFVSFLEELKDVKAELKDTALTNIGFYYNTLDDVKAANILAGIVYIKDLKKLYLIDLSNILEYKTNAQFSIPNEDLTIGNIKIFKSGKISSIKSLELMVDGKPFLSFVNNNILANRDIVLAENNYIKSINASEDKGFRLYDTPSGSVLEVDTIICRKSDKDFQRLDASTIYGNNDNVIIKTTKKEVSGDDTKVDCQLKYTNTFKKDDIVYIYESPEIAIISLSTFNYYGIQGITVLLSNKVTEDINLQVFYNYYYSANISILAGSTSAMYIPGLSDTTNPVADTTITENTESDIVITDVIILSAPANVKLEGDNTNITNLNKSDIKQYKIFEVSENKITLLIKTEGVKEFLKAVVNLKIHLISLNYLIFEKSNLKLNELVTKIDKETNPDTGEEILKTTYSTTIHSHFGNIKDKETKLDTALKQYEDLLKYQEEHPDEPILKPLEKPIKDLNQWGIYTDYFIGYNTVLYNTNFKYHYPKYDKSLSIPVEKTNKTEYDDIIPNIKWVKQLLGSAMPSGTIIMYYPKKDKKIPKGWAVCDGKNGTPDLRGKFIKASDVDNMGENITDLNVENKYSLKKENIPNHTHPHIHNYTIGSITGYTDVTDLGDITSTDTFDFVLSTGTSRVLKSASLTENKPKEGEAVGTTYSLSTTDASVIDSVTPDYRGVTLSIGSHAHSFSITDDTLKSTSGVVNSDVDENSLPETVTAIKFEPHAYSLVFLMKL